MRNDGTERLKAIAQALEKGEHHAGDTVRTLLSWFDAQRRGYWVVTTIRESLKEAGLTTNPDFESAFIDSKIEFLREQPIQDQEPVATTPEDSSDTILPRTSSPSSADEHPSTELTNHFTQVSDPSFRLSKLAAANQVPVSINPDASLSEAVTIMLSKGYSQLPVMTSEREVKGAISWLSIAHRFALNKTGNTVRDFMDKVEILASDSSLFQAVQVIAEKQYVLVRDAERRIVGIVTASDISNQFQTLAEPFLLLSEIENGVRRVLDSAFSGEDLSSSKDPYDVDRSISSAHDLTFGEYIKLLENPKKWEQLKLPLNRAEFIRQLDQIRTIRNDVMHFDPDGITQENLTILRDFSTFMQRLRDLDIT